MRTHLLARLRKHPRESLFYVLPLALALLVFTGVVYPRYRAVRLAEELLHQRQVQVSRYERNLQEMRSALKKPRVAPGELEQKVFQGSDPYVLVASLRERLEKVPGVNIRSFRIIKRQKIAPLLERVEVSFVLQTDIKGLAEALWQLEEEPRAVRLKRVSIFFRRSRQKEILNVTLNLEGLFWLKKS